MGFGTPPLSAESVWAYATRVLTNLADVRAALIDNLDALISSRQATLTFERYYYGTLAGGAFYTPADSGVFSAAMGITPQYIRAEYYGTAWSLLKWGKGTAVDEVYALEFAIGDGTNFRFQNRDLESREIVVMRMS